MKKVILVVVLLILICFFSVRDVFCWQVTSLDIGCNMVPADGETTTTVTVAFDTLWGGDFQGGEILLTAYPVGIWQETGSMLFWSSDENSSPVILHIYSNVPGQTELYARNYYFGISKYMTFYRASFSPGDFPKYVELNGTVNLIVSVEPEELTGTYTWTKVSGPGNATFSSAGATTTFSADTPGMYVVQCEFLANGAEHSYIAQSYEIYVYKVEFFTHGTTNEISEAHVGTDGNSNTTQDGETSQIDIKISPSGLTLDFELDNTEADITPSSGSGTTTVTITGKGDGYSDSEIKVTKNSIELGSLNLQIHKPDRMENECVIPIAAETGWVGSGNTYLFDIKDIQNRNIPNLKGYRIYERLHIDQNLDGKGGAFYSDLISKLDCTPYIGVILPDTELFNDTVKLWIPQGTTTADITSAAIVQFHNSFYMMDVYLKNSTYQNTWTPIINGTNVTGLILGRTSLNDSQRVTEADDDID